MSNKLNRSDFPPAIGTIEMRRKVDGDLKTIEAPIIETYEFQGEWFGVHLDLDYFGALAGVDSDDIDAPGEYTITHVGTGSKPTTYDDWGSIEYVKLIAAKHWRKYNFYDFYERAKRKGYDPVRGTVLPIEVTGQ